MEQHYIYKYSDNNWRSVPYEITNTEYKIPKNLKVATYNILRESHFKPMQYFEKSSTRYKYQVNSLLFNTGADIIGLNEVTQDYLINYILTSEWIKAGYYISSIVNSFKTNEFNLILSKFPFDYYTFNVGQEITVGAVFTCETNSFIVLSAHLTSGENNKKIRQKELKTLMHILGSSGNNENENESFINAIISGNIILMGDLNTHLVSENQILYSCNFVDLWIESGNQEGEGSYTFDNQDNTMNQIRNVLDNRRMRLDRILLFRRNNLFDIREGKMMIFGNEKIYSDFSFSYLYPSDHFGLLVELELKENYSKYKIKRPEFLDFYAMEHVNLDITGFRTIRRIIIYRIIVVAVVVLILLIIILKLIL